LESEITLLTNGTINMKNTIGSSSKGAHCMHTADCPLMSDTPRLPARIADGIGISPSRVELTQQTTLDVTAE
jgi:hypothetical protein